MNEPKLALEKTFELCGDFAKQLFSQVAEPQAVMFTFIWRVGKNDFPPGIMIPRDKEISVDTLIEGITQLGKHAKRFFALTEEGVGVLNTQISKLQKELEQLKNLKASQSTSIE